MPNIKNAAKLPRKVLSGRNLPKRLPCVAWWITSAIPASMKVKSGMSKIAQAVFQKVMRRYQIVKKEVNHRESAMMLMVRVLRVARFMTALFLVVGLVVILVMGLVNFGGEFVENRFIK